MIAPRWSWRILALLTGSAVLWASNALLDPVPVAAGPAFGLGAAAMLRPRGGKLRTILGWTATGTLLGIAVHGYWHAEGSSPPPAGSLALHLLAEGAVGLAAALLALAAGAVPLMRGRRP